MREYNYNRPYGELLTPDIVALLALIHEFKGGQARFVEAGADTLAQLVELAKIQSTETSNKIEGIHTSDDRLKKIVHDKTMPRTRNEQEIAGYRDVLATIHESHAYIPPHPSFLLQLHRDLYKYSGVSAGGSYKNSDNLITGEDEQGNRKVRFRPVPAWETAEAVEKACAAFNDALKNAEQNPLLLIPMFVLDFLCIHPFNDGNGRMSRLLTLLLLYRAGYTVGKYISVEKIIEQTKETYYEALQRSSEGWHEGRNDYGPFVRYMLGVIVAAYREFDSRTKLLAAGGLSKAERVREVLREAIGTFTKTEIVHRCPDIAQVTVQRALRELVKSGDVIKIGGGRYTSYIWNGDKEN